MKIKIFFIVAFSFIFVINLNAQIFRHTSVAIGLSTSQMVNDNPAGKSIQPSSADEPIVFGGGFVGAQPGFEVRITTPFSDNDRWRIPYGIDYQFYTAKERIPIGRNIEDKRFHSLQIITPFLGLNYVLQDLEYLNAKTYVGAELRLAMINNIVNRLEENYFFLDQFDTTINYATKGNATRLGGIVRVGVEAMLFKPLELNASVGVSLMNAVFRDDARRELLTPFKLFETQERYLWNLNFSLLFQYTF